MEQRVSRSWLALAVALACAIGSPSNAEVNLLTNPGFESGGGSYAGWFTFGSGVQLSLPTGDNIIRTGSAASKIYGEFSGCPGSPQFSVGGYGQAFTPTVGKVYEASGYSFMSNADPIPGSLTCESNRLIVKIVYFNAVSGGSEIASNELVIGDWDTPRNRWIPFTVSAPAPAGALRVEILFLYLQPACDPGAIYVDDTAFCQRDNPAQPNLLSNPSFNTNLAGWSVFGNVFHDSRPIIVRTPSGSAKLFSTFQPDAPSGLFQTFAASPGTAWQLDVYSLTTCREDPITGGNNNYAVARIVYRDSSNNQLGAAEQVILTNSSPLGTWTQHTVVAGSAPPGTVAVEPFILLISPALEGGAMWVDDARFVERNPADVPLTGPGSGLELGQNVPNPFAHGTRIDFALPAAGPVQVEVFDLGGRSVAELFRGDLSEGSHQLNWDGRLANGRPAPAGIYHYRIRTLVGEQSRSMLLTR